LIDVLRCWDNVIVPGQHNGHTDRDQTGGVADQAREPRQFVTELRTGLRIAVGQV
jgi:hypothetical protein